MQIYQNSLITFKGTIYKIDKTESYSEGTQSTKEQINSETLNIDTSIIPKL